MFQSFISIDNLINFVTTGEHIYGITYYYTNIINLDNSSNESKITLSKNIKSQWRT